MMAALASYRDDISGLLTTTGSSTAYLVTTNQGLCTAGSSVPNDGQQLSITMSATNGVSPTLLADTCNAYPIQSAAGVGVGAASLIQGSPYTFRFSVANSAWMLRDFYGSALTVPLGGLVPYTLSTVPNSNFVFPAGQCLSTTTYVTYWTALGTPASGSCPGGQFQIIDLSGRVPAGLDTMPGFSAANRLTSASTGCGTAMTSVGATCANGAQSYTFARSNLPNTNVAVTITDPGHTHSFTAVLGNPFSAATGGGGLTAATPSGGTTGSSTTGISAAFNLNGNVAQTAMPVVQPTVGVTYLLRVL
ncbi:hypothetical protein SAMN05444170_0964 [Bradyrhizobium erythrophlei]|uniref:Microcystin-dependent protein n=2 Tax=Bradyrhizobium erythrophlei TaxID=1437360 RepID=A0A1M7T729_9BRAD|nr:hypothetical protein SAMN05444170_0964 [Bradyrhizobium erythrophlei]